MKNYLKMGLTLMLFAVAVAVLLSVVYTITKGPIEDAELNVKLQSIKTVLSNPEDEELMIDEKDIPETESELKETVWKETDDAFLFESSEYKGYVSSPAYKFSLKNGKPAYVVTGAAVGYGGYVTVMCSFVGDFQNLEMMRMQVLDYSQETPGLGAKIAEKDAKERFFEIPKEALEDGLQVDKDAGVSSAKTDEQIHQYKEDGVIYISDIMTGATITPRGVANAVNTMFDYLRKELGGE